jgi:hypothetical protein
MPKTPTAANSQYNGTKGGCPMIATVEYWLFGFAFLVMFVLFLSLNYVSFTIYNGIISTRSARLSALLWALLFHIVSLIPLFLAIEARARWGVVI